MSGEAGSRRSGRETALRALVRVEQDCAYLNLALPALLEKLPPEERNLAVRLAAGTLQRLNTLDWALNLFLRRPLNNFTPWIRNLLRLSAYQLLYMDQVPGYAAVDEAVTLARRFGHRGVAGLVNAVLRRLSRETGRLPWPDPGENPVQYLSLKYSYPLWLTARVTGRLGFEEAERWCLANNEKAPVSVRPNLLRTKPERLKEKLEAENIKAVESPVVPGVLRIEPGGVPVKTEAFREGLFTIQGESSALVVPLFEPEPGATVIDLCSAPGGKTTHLAELMEDRGRIFAVDLHKSRLQLVARAARRLGFTSIKCIQADGRTIVEQKLPQPQAVLVDAPCSGLGVIRRLPEIKWRREEQDLFKLQKMQIELLCGAAALLPPGGKLLYSVCTTEPEETIDVVGIFNSRHESFHLEPLPPLLPPQLRKNQGDRSTVTLWPHRHGLDGFYIALWRKKG